MYVCDSLISLIGVKVWTSIHNKISIIPNLSDGFSQKLKYLIMKACFLVFCRIFKNEERAVAPKRRLITINSR